MTAPGFTGESAVYVTAGRYRTGSRPAAPGAVEPAALSLRTRAVGTKPVMTRPGGSGEPCIDCVCVTPEGCPCCRTMVDPRVAMRESSTVLTCEPGSESMCQDWCDHSGGGMSSNPDGSTSCTVYS